MLPYEMQYYNRPKPEVEPKMTDINVDLDGIIDGCWDGFFREHDKKRVKACMTAAIRADRERVSEKIQAIRQELIDTLGLDDDHHIIQSIQTLLDEMEI